MATPVQNNGYFWSPSPTLTPLNPPQPNFNMYQSPAGYMPQGESFAHNTSNALNEIMLKLSNIEGKVAKLDQIEQAVSKIAIRVSAVEKNVSKLSHDSQKQEESMNFISEKFDNYERERQSTIDKIKNLEKASSNLSKCVENIRNDMKHAGSRAVDQEARSRRNNLIFTGLEENHDENCEEIIRSFMQDKLNLDTEFISSVQFHRVHRLGKNVTPDHNRKPRPVIAGFVLHQDREKVRKLGRQLANKPFSMFEDFPREIREARQQLLPELKQLKSQGKRATIVYPAKLIAEGRLVKEIKIKPPTTGQ